MTEATTKRRASSTHSVPESGGFGALLVPVDLTPNSDRVLQRVARLPLLPDAHVTLLHVVPSNLSPAERQQAERDADKVLAEEVRQLRKRLSRKVSIAALVTVGQAAKEIATRARQLRVELIVMGRGGGRVLRETFLGSTAERVVRQAQRPVLVVRLPARAPYGRPALALGLDEVAHDAVRLMLHTLPAPRPRVEVLHACDLPYQGLIYPSLSEDDGEQRKDELRAKASRDLSKLLSAALKKAQVAPEHAPHWKTTVRVGSPRLVVEKALKRGDHDLLVLGTHAYSGPAYVLLGTVAGDLLRSAKCDVLMVPPSARHK